MRTPILLSLLLAATTGACSQSLTSKMTGTGGTGTGTGDTGGSSPNPGTGGYLGTTGGSLGTGYGGNSVPAICNTLAAEYQSALTAAESCEVGASGQCQQVVSGALSGCTCPTYATDSSALATIANAWQAAGCAPTTEPPCGIFCPAALNSTCVSTDGGSAGFCSYVPGTGGIQRRRRRRRHRRHQRIRWLIVRWRPRPVQYPRLRVRGRVDRRKELHRRRRWPVRAGGPLCALPLLGLRRLRDRPECPRRHPDELGCGRLRKRRGRRLPCGLLPAAHDRYLWSQRRRGLPLLEQLPAELAGLRQGSHASRRASPRPAAR